MKPKNRILQELKWLAAVVLLTVLVVAIVPRPWLGAYWVFPIPNTRGPVWVNAGSPMLWHLAVFFALLAMVGLIRIIWGIIHRNSKKAQQ